MIVSITYSCVTSSKPVYEWRPHISHLLFSPTFKVLSHSGIFSASCSFSRIAFCSDLVQSLHQCNSKKLNRNSNGSYSYAYDNTLGLQTRVKESQSQLVWRVKDFVNTVDNSYRKITGVLSKARSACAQN